MDDDYFEDDGIFAHLEGIRASLEDQLGCETFLKAYATVQVCIVTFSVRATFQRERGRGLRKHDRGGV